MNRSSALPRNATEAIKNVAIELGIEIEIPKDIVNTFESDCEYTYMIPIENDVASSISITVRRERISYFATYVLL
jgi:hypothetical protein